MSCYPGLSPHFLQESLRSLYNDDFQKKDIFIYCDGILSNNLYNIIDSFNEYGLKAFYSDYNKGLASAMNFLIDIVIKFDYEYIARMDADDIVFNQRFTKQYNFLEQNPSVDILGGWCIEVNGAGVEVFKKVLPTKHSELKKIMITRSCMIHPTVMLRTSIFKNGIRYNENLYNYQDYDLWSRLFAFNYTLENLNDFILKFRIDDDFIGRRKGFKRFKQKLLAHYEHLKRNNILNLYTLFLIFLSASTRLLPTFILKFLYKKAR